MPGGGVKINALFLFPWSFVNFLPFACGGILQAEKFGRDWQIDAESVEIRRKAMEQKKRES